MSEEEYRRDDTENVARLLEAYLAKVEVGESVDIDSFLAPHQGVAERVRHCLESLRLVGSASSELHQAIHVFDGLGTEIRRIGDFRIIREIGRGGMGVVYEAEHETLTRRVALKILPYAALLDERRLARFQNEARAAAILQHPHIVDVFSVGKDRGIHFYVMELIEGCSLGELIASVEVDSQEPTGIERGFSNQTRITEMDTAPLAELSTQRSVDRHSFVRSVARLGIQAANALQYAHEQRVIHRDIKPSNLLLDHSGKLHVADFGLAMFLDESEELTRTGDVIGTMRYMSPEQANGEPIDQRTDIYSLGLTLYEVLAGEPAMQGKTRPELIKNINAGISRRSLRKAGETHRDFETILLKSMAHSREERYRSAAEMSTDLQRFLDYRPIASRRSSAARQLIGWTKRNPQLASVTFLLAFMMISFSAVSGIIAWNSANDANRQRDALYARDIQHAQNAIEDGMPVEARNTLSRWLPKPGDRDPRGWEWHWLSKQIDRLTPSVIIKPGPAGADCIRFTHDGTELFAGHFGNRFSLFDLQSKERTWVTRRPNSSINSLVVLLKRNELAALESDGTVSFWDLVSRQEVRSWNAGFSTAGSFSVSSDNRYIAITPMDESGRVIIFDVESGDRVRSFENTEAACAVFAADRLVLCAGGTMQAIETDSWHVVEEQSAIRSAVRQATATGSHVAISYSDKESRNSRIEIWDAARLARTASFNVSADVRALAFSPDAATLAVGDEAGFLHLFNLGDEFPIVRERLHSAAIDDVDFSPDGFRLATTSRDMSIRCWDVASLPERRKLPTFGETSSSDIHGVDFFDRGRKLCSVESTGRVRTFDIASEVKHDEFFVECENSNRSRLRTSHTGIQIAVGRYRFPSETVSTQAAIYNSTKNGKPVQFSLPNGTYRTSLAFSRDGRLLALGAQDEIVIRSTTEDRIIATVALKHKDTMPVAKAVAFSKDGQTLYCGCEHGFTAVVPVSKSPNWTPDRWVNTHTSLLMSCDVSPDGEFLAVVGFDERVTFWKLPSMKPSEISFDINTEPLLHVRFSPDGKRLLTTSRTGNATVWDTSSGHRLLTIPVSDGWLETGCFSPDGRSLLVCSGNQIYLLTIEN